MIIASPTAMQEAGELLAARLDAGDIVALHGGLGAGKTLFCKGVLRGLGYAGDVHSPTYTITQHYLPPDVRLSVVHADLYRIDHADEMEELGLFDPAMVHLVEWAENGGRSMEDARFTVRIERIDDDRRELTLQER